MRSHTVHVAAGVQKEQRGSIARRLGLVAGVHQNASFPVAVGREALDPWPPPEELIKAVGEINNSPDTMIGRLENIRKNQDGSPLKQKTFSKLRELLEKSPHSEMSAIDLASAQRSVWSSVGHTSEYLIHELAQKTIEDNRRKDFDASNKLVGYRTGDDFQTRIKELRKEYRDKGNKTSGSLNVKIHRCAEDFFVTVDFVKNLVFQSEGKVSVSYPDSVSLFADGRLLLAEQKLGGENDSNAVPENIRRLDAQALSFDAERFEQIDLFVAVVAGKDSSSSRWNNSIEKLRQQGALRSGRGISVGSCSDAFAAILGDDGQSNEKYEEYLNVMHRFAAVQMLARCGVAEGVEPPTPKILKFFNRKKIKFFQKDKNLEASKKTLSENVFFRDALNMAVDELKARGINLDRVAFAILSNSVFSATGNLSERVLRAIADYEIKKGASSNLVDYKTDFDFQDTVKGLRKRVQEMKDDGVTLEEIDGKLRGEILEQEKSFYVNEGVIGYLVFNPAEKISYPDSVSVFQDGSIALTEQKFGGNNDVKSASSNIDELVKCKKMFEGKHDEENISLNLAVMVPEQEIKGNWTEKAAKNAVTVTTGSASVAMLIGRADGVEGVYSNYKSMVSWLVVDRLVRTFSS